MWVLLLVLGAQRWDVDAQYQGAARHVHHDADFDDYYDQEDLIKTSALTTRHQETHTSRVRRFEGYAPRTLSEEEIRDVKGALKELMAGRNLNELSTAVFGLKSAVERVTRSQPFNGLTKSSSGRTGSVPEDPTKFYENIIEDIMDHAKRQGSEKSPTTIEDLDTDETEKPKNWFSQKNTDTAPPPVEENRNKITQDIPVMSLGRTSALEAAETTESIPPEMKIVEMSESDYELWKTVIPTRSPAREGQETFPGSDYMDPNDNVLGLRNDDTTTTSMPDASRLKVGDDIVSSTTSTTRQPITTTRAIESTLTGTMLLRTATGSSTKSRRTRRKTTTPIPPKFVVDVETLVDIIANLTLDYELINITDLFNKTLLSYNIPKCLMGPTTTTTSTSTTTPEPPSTMDLLNATVVSKCFVCGLDTEAIPRNAWCADAFAGDFIPIVKVDPMARGQLSNYRKYCRYLDVNGMLRNETQPRSVYGRFTGGCSVRWIDLSGVYTQRACRNRRHATMGKHFVSKRMAKLEMALSKEDEGCVISPMSSLVPLSRGISLYARFHACVCTGSWCNHAVSPPRRRRVPAAPLLSWILLMTMTIC